MAQEKGPTSDALLTLSEQIKKLQGQLIELKVSNSEGNGPRGSRVSCKDPWNPGREDPPFDPSAPPPENPGMWEPPLQPPVWEKPTQPPPGYIKPESDSFVVRSPLQMACEQAHRQGESTEQFGVYPTFDRIDRRTGVRVRHWEPFQWKEIKELKEACVQYGPIAPFTMAILDALSGEATPPEDWKPIAHACLSGGDYLLWKSEFYESCKKKANQNALRRVPITFEMLAGEGIYANIENQMGFAPGAYAQTSVAAKDAWRILPDTSRKEEHVSQIRQRPDEPFQDFVSRLTTAAGRIFGTSIATQSFITQLAYENANSACQAVIRPIRKKGTLSDYIRPCTDVGSSFTQGIAIAAALQGKPMKEVLWQQARLNVQGVALELVLLVERRDIERLNAPIREKQGLQLLLLRNLQMFVLNAGEGNIGLMNVTLRQIKMGTRFRETG